MSDGAPARMNFSDKLAARYEVPPDIEEWRFELVLALRNPDWYSAALATVDNSALYGALTRIVRVGAAARVCIQHFVPGDMEDDFHDGLDDLRGRVLAEAAARSVNLVQWPSHPSRAH